MIKCFFVFFANLKILLITKQSISAKKKKRYKKMYVLLTEDAFEKVSINPL